MTGCVTSQGYIRSIHVVNAEIARGTAAHRPDAYTRAEAEMVETMRKPGLEMNFLDHRCLTFFEFCKIAHIDIENDFQNQILGYVRRRSNTEHHVCV